jgi:hypothetical protein
VLSVALLAALFARLIRDNLELKAGWRRLLSMRGPAAALSAILVACTLLCTPGHAYSTPDTELLNDLNARLSRPPKCVPNCAEIMSARIVLTPSTLDAGFEVAALSSVAVALPSAGQRFDPDAIAVDGLPVAGVYRDSNQQIWIALKPGAHTVKLSGRLPAVDSIQLLFPQVPRVIAVSGDGWDISGINAGRLLGNTIELLRRRVAGQNTDTAQGTAQIPPYVRYGANFHSIWIGRCRRLCDGSRLKRAVSRSKFHCSRVSPCSPMESRQRTEPEYWPVSIPALMNLAGVRVCRTVIR